MIGVILPYGKQTYGLLAYLFGPGEENEHVDPRVIAGCRPPSLLEPPVRDDGSRALAPLVTLLEAPLKLLGDRAADEPVLHITLSAASGDPEMGDGAWADIAEEAMHRLGLDVRGQEEEAVPWVAVRHDPRHIHIAAVLARADGRRAHLHRERVQLGKAMRWAEEKYGLQRAARPDRTAPNRATRAEEEKAARAGRSEPPRYTLRRHVEAAAATAADEAGFFADLESRGLKVWHRASANRPGEITGYSVGLLGDLTAAGGQIWYGGGKLASYLTLPKLRRRWGGPMSGHRMSPATARIVLRREVTAAAAASVSEASFFAGLTARGLNVEHTSAPDRPGVTIGYSVGLHGSIDRTGRPVRWAGSTLGSELALGQLRAHWRAGMRGAAPPSLFGGADSAEIWAHATSVARAAAADFQSGRGTPGVALAAADVLIVAADVTGSRELRQAAEAFGRAARIPGGRRVPRSTSSAESLRTAARLLAASRPPRRHAYSASGTAVLLLIVALVLIAMALAVLRARQRREHQARAALDAGLRLTAEADSWTPPPPAPVSISGRTRGRTLRPATARLGLLPGINRTAVLRKPAVAGAWTLGNFSTRPSRCRSRRRRQSPT